MFRYKLKSYCFSPPVMIATFVLELSYFLYILIARKLDRTAKLALALLFCLATFQLAEYGICEKWGLSGEIWARIGFVAITFLPVLGLHLTLHIAQKVHKRLLIACYMLTFAWVGVFLFGNVLQGSVCSGNYVIFAIPDRYELSYYAFYNSQMALAICLALRYASMMRQKKRTVALQALAIGYLAFIVPSMFFSAFDAHSGPDSNLPSVMCGFAVIFATIITFKVIPLTTSKRGE